MSSAGFIFDMIRRDKENRNLRLPCRERLSERLDKMYKGRRMPRNITAEDMEKIAKSTRQKKHSEQKHTVRMMLTIIGGYIIIASVLVLLFTRQFRRRKRTARTLMNFPRFINKFR